MQGWTEIGSATSPILIVADHASACVPPQIHLGIDPVLLKTHIAVDIGVTELTAALCDLLDCRAILGATSRLVVDLNRDVDDPAVVPTSSDGIAIPGNALDREQRRARLDRFWHPYHNRLFQVIAAHRPGMIVSLHSFTPQLATAPAQPRPWDIGILYNEDNRAPQIAIPLLEATGACVGDQQPYSGKVLNASMNRHAEAHGIAYLGIEMRQDRIGDPAGVALWADILAPVILTCANGLSTQ
jgi:predicted N-formylglutamate amidohydrolase